MVISLAAALLFSLVFLSIAEFVMWTRSDVPYIRVASIVVAVMLSAALTVSLMFSAGLPTNVMRGFNVPHGPVTVLGAKIDQDKALYFLLDVPGKPRLVELPWDGKMAEKVQKILNDPSGQPIELDDSNNGGAKGNPAGSDDSAGAEKVKDRPEPASEMTKDAANPGQSFDVTH